MENKKFWELLFIIIFVGISTLFIINIIGKKIQYNNNESLSFTQVSDVHFLKNGKNYHGRMIKDSPQILDSVIEDINDDKDLDFVFFTGDLVDKPKIEELKEVNKHLANIDKPWYFAFGNHDRCTGSMTKQQYLNILIPQSKAMQDIHQTKTYYSFIPKPGYRVLALDTIICTKSSIGMIYSEQLKWIENELAKAQDSGETVMMFMHIPVQPPYYDKGHELFNDFEVKNILSRYKVPVIMLSGHFHGTRILKDKNVLYIATPSLVTYPNAYRKIKVTNLNNSVVVNIKFKQIQDKSIVSEAKKNNHHKRRHSGNRRDKSAVYNLKRF